MTPTGRSARRIRGLRGLSCFVAILALAGAGCGSPSATGSKASAGATATTQPGASSPTGSPGQTATPKPVISTRVTAFFYLWYGTPAHDGDWRHWNQMGHQPPDDIASEFYPAAGPYSSRDPAVLATQMAELRSAGVGVIAVSWWGPGSWEDGTLDTLFAAASKAGVEISFHLEPYTGRTAASVVADIRNLLSRYRDSPALYRIARPTAASNSTAPRPVFYIFNTNLLDDAALKSGLATLRGTPDDAIVLVQSPRVAPAVRAGADGIYPYDVVNVGPDRFASMIADCRAANLICSPTVGPGFDNRQAVAGGQAVARDDGGRYDASWQGAIAATAEWVSIATFNEWHEGTQIEPARSFQAGGRTYPGYDGAYGLTGAAAPNAYLERTEHWVAALDTGGG